MKQICCFLLIYEHDSLGLFLLLSKYETANVYSTIIEKTIGDVVKILIKTYTTTPIIEIDIKSIEQYKNKINNNDNNSGNIKKPNKIKIHTGINIFAPFLLLYLL